jgi:hypothetical protein
MIEDIHEDQESGTLHLKISNQQVAKELQKLIPLIEMHLASGKGYVLQVGENFQLSVALTENKKQGITGQIKILSITKKETSTASVSFATIGGIPSTILNIRREILGRPMITEQKQALMKLRTTKSIGHHTKQ